MTKRNHFLALIFLSFFAVYTVSCVFSREMTITNITLMDDSMVITIRGPRAARAFFGTLFIEYKNIPVPDIEFFDRTRHGGIFAEVGMSMEIKDGPGRLEVTLVLDLSDVASAIFEERNEYLSEGVIILYRNEEARLAIELFGAAIDAHIFIGEDRIDILEQRH